MIDFIKSAMIRAVRTMAQTAVSLIGTGAIGILDVDWVSVASASALAGLLSILTSIATGLPEGSEPVEMTDDEADDLIDDCPELLDVE